MLGFRILAGPSQDGEQSCINVLADVEQRAERNGSNPRRNFVPLCESRDNLKKDAILLFPREKGSVKAGKIIATEEEDDKLIIHYQKPKHVRKNAGESQLIIKLAEINPNQPTGQDRSILIENHGAMRDELRADIWWLLTWDKKFLRELRTERKTRRKKLKSTLA